MESEFQTWRADGVSLRIVYGKAAMESMRQAAMVGLQKVPRRGLEIGGVLFGQREGDEIRILEWREIVCEHARGPGFDLSESDEAALAELLKEAADDPAMSGLDPVGWFRTRTKDAVVLSEADVAFYDRYFPEPWQIVLVIRPHMYEPAQAGFFFRDGAGDVQAGASRNEFQLENRRRRLPVGFDPRQRPRKPDAPAEAPWRAAPPSREPGDVPPRPAFPAAPPRARAPKPVPRRDADGRPTSAPYPVDYPRRRSTRLIAIAAAVVGVLLLGVFLLAPALDRDGMATGIGLQVRDVAGQLVVEWNPISPIIAEAPGAAMHIVDGAEVRSVDLTPEDLSSGSLVYQRRTGDVEFNLVLAGTGATPVSEIARYVGAEPAVAPQSSESIAQVRDLATSVESLREQLKAELDRSKTLQLAIDAEKRKLGIGTQ